MKAAASVLRQFPCGLNLKQPLFWRNLMKLRFLCSLLFLAPALLSGQDKGMGSPVAAYTELKQYLSLTDAQVQSLQTILDNRSQAVQNIYTHRSARRTKRCLLA